jgi:hypothetical protein
LRVGGLGAGGGMEEGAGGGGEAMGTPARGGGEGGRA